MPVKVYKRTTNGRRNASVLVYDQITTSTPEKSLLTDLRKTGGRNNTGRITVRHIGGGNKRKYRIIDFKRNDKNDIPATVKTIEYDPNRTAFIALVCYKDGEKRYILAPEGLKVGDTIVASENADIIVGNQLPLCKIPVGTVIHNIELHPGQGAQLVRSAGASAQILGREDKYVLIRLTSGEVRYILANCTAVIGTVSNPDHALARAGKAGHTRYLGVRPTVRGSAMNPNDHPHGGGEGKAPIGRKAPLTPWGKPAMGKKTRDTKKNSNRLIVHRINDK